MYTIKDYQAIAEIIKSEIEHWTSDTLTQPEVKTAIDEIAYNLATYFIKDNPNFDRDKFKAACGLS